MLINGFNHVDSAASQNKHNETVHGTKLTEISSIDRTKPDAAQSTLHGSHRDNDRPSVNVSTSSKAAVVPTFKISITGQVI